LEDMCCFIPSIQFDGFLICIAERGPMAGFHENSKKSHLHSADGKLMLICSKAPLTLTGL